MKTGIYKIENLVNNKKYVGFASDIDYRWTCHKNQLKAKSHHCYHLQKAFNKYGEENFIYEILEECLEEELPKKEHYWAILLKVHNRKFGYNIKPTSEDGKVRHAEETKRKIGRAHKGRIVKPESIEKQLITKKERAKRLGYTFAPNSKIWQMYKDRRGKPVSPNMLPAMRAKLSIKVKQYTIVGQYIKTWDCMADAERAMTNGRVTGKISMVAKGQRPSAYKFIWRYEDDKFDKYPYIARGTHPNSGQNRK